jgi:EAL domain-containing protein (putative c-di-GMP-specific phosphodiesterase class I)
MHTEMLARSELQRDLAQARRLGQFVLHYQPVVDLSSGDLLGLEALIRWQHPTRGLLAPGEFIALAEDTGQIIEIGEWVVDQACRDLAARHREMPDGLWMSVNVSAHQLTNPAFVAMVKGALDRHSVPAGSLVVEITEGVAVTNIASATEALTQLHRYGVQVALDDFGTGFSSLRYLHELPIDIIKIDRSFVMDQKGKTDSMLEAIVTLGHSLGLDIIAEGIEQSSELERLRRLGHLAGQGYLFARPMPAAAVAEFHRGNGPVAERRHQDTLALRPAS